MIEIARDIFQMTMELVDPTSGAMKPLAGIRIEVFQKDTTTPVNIYQRRTGATEGPAPETAGTNLATGAFTTGPTGAVEFWCDGPAERDIRITDTQGPARIPQRTMGWNFIPAAAASFPSSMLAADAGVSLGALSPAVMRQVHQIGEVIDWWRPQASVPIPSGFEICDGRQIAAGNHDFAGLGASNINLPDLRNKFILGAVASTLAEAGGGAAPWKAHGAGGTIGDAASDSPGIAGGGGSQSHVLTGPQTGTKSHSHSGTTGSMNRNQGHVHPPDSSGAGNQRFFTQTQAGDVLPLWSQAYGQGSYTWPQYIKETTGYTNTDHEHAFSTTGNPADADAGTAHNNIPRYMGLLKLMKVRYS